jgi:tetratricopeptide (TPR) repeat protein
MEALYPSPAGELIDRLAHHAVAGEVWDKAVVYARQAGDRALRSFATHKAVEYFEHALGALRHLGEHRQAPLQELDLQLRLRDALWPLGRLTEMLACLREADELAARAGDCRRQGWIACYLAHYHWSVAENDQALAAGQRARAIAEALDDPALAAETSFYVGITQLALGQSQQAVDTLRAALPQLDRAVETCESSFPSPRFALSGRPLLRSWLTRSLAELGHFREGLTLGEDALQVAEASHSPFGVIAAAAGLGHLRLRQGRALAVPLLATPSAMSHLRLSQLVPHGDRNLSLAYISLDRMAGDRPVEQSAGSASARASVRPAPCGASTSPRPIFAAAGGRAPRRWRATPSPSPGAVRNAGTRRGRSGFSARSRPGPPRRTTRAPPARTPAPSRWPRNRGCVRSCSAAT